jgi:hypothetical protein
VSPAPRPGSEGKQSGRSATPLSPEEVAAVLAVVQAAAEEEAAAADATKPAPQPKCAWAAAGRPGRPQALRKERPRPSLGKKD